MTRQTRPISWIRAALKEFESFPEGAQVDLSDGLNDRCGGREGGYCEADAWAGIGSVRDCAAVPGRRIPRNLRGATRRGNLGSSCVSKEIDVGHQDAET